MTTEQIVTRLKQYAKQCYGVHSCWNAPTLLAAAALIESQAAEIARLNDFQNSQCAKLLEKLNAAERRERAAVEDMAQNITCGACIHVHTSADDEPCCSCWSDSNRFEWCGAKMEGKPCG